MALTLRTTSQEAALPGLVTLDEAAAIINQGRVLWISGEEALLRHLPKGRWIGGTIHYFMTRDGGTSTRDQVFVTEFPESLAKDLEIRSYGADNIHTIAKDAPRNGFAILLIPSGSDVHLTYAEHAPEYEDMFKKPIAGWVTGVHLSELGKTKALAFSGETGEAYADKAVAMFVHLQPGKMAEVVTVNPWHAGEGAVLEFPETGFSATRCFVNGVERPFAAYLDEVAADQRYPLVGDYAGARVPTVNVSFQGIDRDSGRVSFYAPVFRGIKYKLAAPLSDYVTAFESAMPPLRGGETVFSCNCVLNYLHMQLEGKRIAGTPGPMTFGEIAYQLLNQTMVYLTVANTPRAV